MLPPSSDPRCAIPSHPHHAFPGCHHPDGVAPEEGRTPSSIPSSHSLSRARGFTLVELMIVVVIIGVLASIAISLTIRLLERGYIDTIKSDLLAAYKASVSYHTDNPDSVVTVDILKTHGYVQSPGVTITIDDGSVASLRIRAMHPGATGAYYVDHKGEIQKQ